MFFINVYLLCPSGVVEDLSPGTVEAGAHHGVLAGDLGRGGGVEQGGEGGRARLRGRTEQGGSIGERRRALAGNERFTKV